MEIVPNYCERYRDWANHGFHCMKTNQMEESAYAMVMALHDYQTNPGFWLNIAQATAKFEFFEITNRAIAIAKKIDPNYEALSRITQRLNKYQQFCNQKIGKLSSDQKISRSYNNIAEEAIRNGNYPRALIRLKQSVKNNPSDLNSLLNIATISLQSGDIETGKDALEKALKINPNDAMVYYNFMNLYIIQDNIPKAIQEVRKALDIEPNNQRFQAKIRELENLVN